MTNRSCRSVYGRGLPPPSAGPGEMLPLATMLLLRTFICGNSMFAQIAPWSWSTPLKNASLARQITIIMKVLGVRDELCLIRTASASDVQIANKIWDEFVQKLEMSISDKNSSP